MKISTGRSTLGVLLILMCLVSGMLILSACATAAVVFVPVERGVAPAGPEFDTGFSFVPDGELADYFGPADPVVLLAQVLRQLGLAERVFPQT
jgi:hypothetical protein